MTMSMVVIGVAITKTLNLRQDLVIDGAASCASDFYAPNIYTKTEVNSFLSGKQAALTTQSDLSINTLTTANKLATDTISAVGTAISFKTSANSTMLDLSNTSINMWRSLTMNNYTISGPSSITSSGTINAVGNITSTGGNIQATNGSITGGTITSTRSNNTGTNGGQIFLNGSLGNRIDFANVGVNPPSFSTRSTGTKICLYSVGDTTNVDYAIGIEK